MAMGGIYTSGMRDDRPQMEPVKSLPPAINTLPTRRVLTIRMFGLIEKDRQFK